jgi:serine protease Do
VAVVKIDAADLPAFDLNQAVDAPPGARVLAFSNLFGVAIGNEPVSVQQGIVAAKTPLEARRGTFETAYDGPVYVVDAVTNNPGAAGGALVTRRGELIGMLGKELRNARNNTWLNYALPIDQLRGSVEKIVAGEPEPTPDEAPEKKPARWLTLAKLGIVLMPDVVARTPPYIDGIYTGSPADVAGLRPDDLIVFLNDRLVQTCKALKDELEHIDHEDPVRLTILRDGELVESTLQVTGQSAGTP